MHPIGTTKAAPSPHTKRAGVGAYQDGHTARVKARVVGGELEKGWGLE